MTPAGLYLPTSDLDVVVLGSREADVRAALKAVATGLLRKDLARNVQASVQSSRSHLCESVMHASSEHSMRRLTVGGTACRPEMP